MSNETSTTNSPRLNRVVTRSRKFSCITYLNETQLNVCLVQHSTQIRAYSYAFHDKDAREDGTLKEPHFHLIIVTYHPCTLSAIRRWFSGYVDSNGDITTTAQNCSDVYSMFDFLTHSDKDSKLAGKYQYDKSIIVSNDLNFFNANSRSDYDNILLASEMLLEGYSVRELGQRFGRDFILNYSKIKKYLCDVQLQERNSFDNDNLIKYEINLLNKNDIYL